MDRTAAPSASQTKGYLIALTGTALWSSTAIFIRFLTENNQLPPLVLAFWRELFVSLAMLLVLALFRPSFLRLPRVHVPFFAVYGLVLMIFNATWTISVALNGAAVATVLLYSSPAITALIAWRLWREPLGVRMIVAVTLSLLGCVVLSGAYSPQLWDLNPVGIAIGLASGLMYAGYSIFGKAASRRTINPWSTLTYTFSFAVVFLFLLLQLPIAHWMPAMRGVGGMPELFWLGSDRTGWVILLILALGPTISGYGLYNVSLTYLPASVANLIASLEPPLTAALAYVLLGERMTGTQIIGSLMIIFGVVLLRLGSIREGESPTTR
jgi:drug/metabolite transporter (DMT)-like permease